MNWELTMLKVVTLQELFDKALEKPEYPAKDIEVKTFSEEKNDGGPYGALNNATHWGIEIKFTMKQGTEEKREPMKEGIFKVFEALAIPFDEAK